MNPKLSVRIALSTQMKPYDPLGFVLPTPMVGNLLLRFTMQMLKKEVKGPVIEGDKIQRWLDYFGMLVALDAVKFPRSYKPDQADNKVLPSLVTFGDGNPDSYGSVAYAIWVKQDGSKECRLVMSKAKLAPLLQKGEAVRNELCGATYSAKLKDWICFNSDTTFGKHYHIIDSSIVQAMIKRTSYGINTFAGLCI